eukprot:COSAG06_NODE_15233_length_1088_cov_1.016178_1_plen_123_part_10
MTEQPSLPPQCSRPTTAHRYRRYCYRRPDCSRLCRVGCDTWIAPLTALSLPPWLSVCLLCCCCLSAAVFDVIGTPTQAEIAEIENAKLRRCIAMLEPKAAQPLNRRYPTMPDSYVTHHAATLP